MPTLYVTRGLPGSGKTTRARAWVAEDPARRARVNRDDVRTMLHGGRLGTPEQEQQVTHVCHAGIVALLRAGLDVVADDTNLPDRAVDGFRALAAQAGAEVEVWDFRDVPRDECLRRNAARNGAARVPDEVIVDMWQRYVRGGPRGAATPGFRGPTT